MKKTYICEFCEDEFQRYDYPNRANRYCSKACMGKHWAGPNNPNYKNIRDSNIVCECGRSKDYRSAKCATCANVGFHLGEKRSHNERNDDIEKIIAESRSVVEASRKLDCSRNTVAKYIETHKPDVSHMVRTGKTKGWRAAGDRFEADAKEFLVKRYTGARSRIPRRIILRDGLLEYICSVCKQNPEWLGQELVLELDHINGDKLDDRLENFRFLCPNCHSQTSTFKGKNSKGVPKRRKER